MILAELTSRPEFAHLLKTHRRASLLWREAQQAARSVQHEVDELVGQLAGQWAGEHVGETVWLRGAPVRILSTELTTVVIEHEPVIPGVAGQLEHVAARDLCPEPAGPTLERILWTLVLDAINEGSQHDERHATAGRG